MGQYSHLSRNERKIIEEGLLAKQSVAAIAKKLNRHRSTIHREINRNYSWMDGFDFDGYFHYTAHLMTRDRRKASSPRVLCDELKGFIIEKLKKHWSPEQIAGYLKQAKNGLYACHETIYRFIYGNEGKALGLYRYLFKCRKNRRGRYGRVPRGSHIPLSCTIHQRPENIKQREEFGHWEGDLVMFRKEYGKKNLSTLIERKTRYTFVIKNNDRVSSHVMGQIGDRMKSLPKNARKTLTLDRGTEFANFEALHKQTNVHSYFCDPQSPWQKGSIEHFNARLRKFLPREVDLADVNQKEINHICNQLNHIPRKCLDYRTPHQAFHQELAAMQ